MTKQSQRTNKYKRSKNRNCEKTAHVQKQPDRRYEEISEQPAEDTKIDMKLICWCFRTYTNSNEGTSTQTFQEECVEKAQ